MYSKSKLYKNFVYSLGAKLEANTQKIVFLCIGTNKITGDCFGPLVGTKLKRILKFFDNNRKIEILGDMSSPINYKNIAKILETIEKNSYIIAIDSAISEFYDGYGKIFVTNTGINIGSGLDKDGIIIGNIGIKGCIGKKYSNKYQNEQALKHTTKDIVNNLSNIVSLGIIDVCTNI